MPSPLTYDHAVANVYAAMQAYDDPSDLWHLAGRTEMVLILAPDVSLVYDLQSLFESECAGESLIVSTSTPLTTSNTLRRGCIRVAHTLRHVLTLEALYSVQNAASFPGAVENRDSVESRQVTVQVAPKGRTNWYSLGVYAVDGATIQFEVPASVAGKGVSVRIGCHKDNLWGLSSAQRWPVITESEYFKSTEVTLRNIFGGLVYVDVPSGMSTATFDVTITGKTVWSPLFRDGQWVNGVLPATTLAPWGELEANDIVISASRSVLRAMSWSQPLNAASFWDYNMEAVYALGQTPVKTRKERIVFDLQISAGWMHSGYPVMAHLASTAESLNPSLAAVRVW